VSVSDTGACQSVYESQSQMQELIEVDFRVECEGIAVITPPCRFPFAQGLSM
jgi:hypothetical protein